MRALLQVLITKVAALLGVACVCGAVANTVLPMRIPWSYPWSHDIELRAAHEKIPLVSLQEARDIVDAGAQMVLDARSKTEFEKGHLPGAFSVPQAEAPVALQHVEMLLAKNHAVLVYCAERDCDEGLLLCLFLRERGFGKAALFLDGYRHWVATGLATERGAE